MQLDGHDSHHSDRTSSMVSCCRIEVSSLGVGRRLCGQGKAGPLEGVRPPNIPRAQLEIKREPNHGGV